MGASTKAGSGRSKAKTRKDPRSGWAEAFRRMAEKGDDALLWDESMEQRAKKGSRRKFTKALSKVRDAKPEPHDGL